MRCKIGSGIICILVLLLLAAMPAVVLADHTQEHRVEQSHTRFEVGRMYEQGGDLTQAENYYRQSLDLWPDNVEARDALQHIIEARKGLSATGSAWSRWFALSPNGTPSLVVEAVGWSALILILLILLGRFGVETIRLALLRRRGIPLLELGEFKDPAGCVVGLPHQLAAQINEAGLTFYDEKGAVPPDFTLIGETGFTQAGLLVRLLGLLATRQVERIQVAVGQEGETLNVAVSLVDSSTGYVRYLTPVPIDLRKYKSAGERTRAVARMVADTILIALSRDANTRGLLYQRMGDWGAALQEFLGAAEAAKQQGTCNALYQAHLNLGNLYSFLGLQDKSIAAYTAVLDKVQNPATIALLQAAIACSYLNWRDASPPDQKPIYESLAHQALEKALQHQEKTPLTAYTIACYYSLSGQIEQTLTWLREAVSINMVYLEYAMSDPDMESLRRWLHGRNLGKVLHLRMG